MNQWYAQDVLAGLGAEGTFLDFGGGGPDVMQDWGGINNHANNSFFFHTLGNLGFIGYNGGAEPAQQLSYFSEACAYMGQAEPAAVFLLGHWYDASSGCPVGADVPEVHTLLLTLPGCSTLGTKLKYMDGHTHCNHAGGANTPLPPPTSPVSSFEGTRRVGDEEVGFMIGGHGMAGCSQYGFTLIDSTNGSLSVRYFEERSPAADNFAEILGCVQTHGASGCVHLARTWLHSPIMPAVL